MAGAFRTVVFAVEELFAVTKSTSSAVTDAVFASVPVAVGVTTMVTVADAPGAIEPSAHQTVPLIKVQEPWLDEKETSVAPLLGGVSLASTLFAAAGPLLVTMTV